MSNAKIWNEKRQFGRRQTIWHAWVLMSGRPKQACIVRNFSIGGAQLEFLDVPPPVHSFKLKIEHVRFEGQCEVRHRNGKVVGVFFPEELHTMERSGHSSSSRIVDGMREQLNAAS
jgi:hypothetical protein